MYQPMADKLTWEAKENECAFTNIPVFNFRHLTLCPEDPYIFINFSPSAVEPASGDFGPNGQMRPQGNDRQGQQPFPGARQGQRRVAGRSQTCGWLITNANQFFYLKIYIKKMIKKKFQQNLFVKNSVFVSYKRLLNSDLRPDGKEWR